MNKHLYVIALLLCTVSLRAADIDSAPVKTDTVKVDSPLDPKSFRATVIKPYPAQEALAAAHRIAVVRFLKFDETKALTSDQQRQIAEYNTKEVRSINKVVERIFGIKSGTKISDAQSFTISKTMARANNAYLKKINAEYDLDKNEVYSVAELERLADTLLKDMQAGRGLAFRLEEAFKLLETDTQNQTTDTERVKQ